MNNSIRTLVIAFVAGLIFGLGLLIGGMTNPAKVLNFLDVTGTWDPSLAFVMGAALCLTIPGFMLAKKRGITFFGSALQLPTKSDIDAKLIGGSVLFGLGWGLVGFCPGPALVAFGNGAEMAIVFFVSMVLGMMAFSLIDSKN